MSEGWADFAPGDETVAWSKAEVVAEAIIREVLKARRLDPNRRVLRRELLAKVALTAEWKKGSEGGCISKEGLEGEDSGRYSKTTTKHHATNPWMRRSRIRMLTVCVGMVVQRERYRLIERNSDNSVVFFLRVPFNLILTPLTPIAIAAYMYCCMCTITILHALVHSLPLL